MVVSEPSQPQLQLVDVSKSYLQADGSLLQALRSISLEVRTGECLSILGRSGCGKTTLLRIIAGLEAPDTGVIQLNTGHPHRNHTSTIAMVPQAFSAFPWLTVLENIAFGLRLRGMSKAIRQEKAQHIVDLLQLDGFEGSFPRMLSGGMQQRVAIGRAIAVDPCLLLLDEPFGALDAHTREQMQDLFHSLRERTKMTMIFVTHDIEEALYIAGRFAVIDPLSRTISGTGVVRLPDNRTQELKTTSGFQEQRSMLRRLLNQGGEVKVPEET